MDAIRKALEEFRDEVEKRSHEELQPSARGAYAYVTGRLEGLLGRPGLWDEGEHDPGPPEMDPYAHGAKRPKGVPVKSDQPLRLWIVNEDGVEKIVRLPEWKTDEPRVMAGPFDSYADAEAVRQGRNA